MGSKLYLRKKIECNIKIKIPTCNWRMHSSSCLCNSSWASKVWKNATRRELLQEEHGETPWLQWKAKFWEPWCRWNWESWGVWRGPKQTPSSTPETGFRDQSCSPQIDGKPGFPEYKCAWTAICQRLVRSLQINKIDPKRAASFTYFMLLLIRNWIRNEMG